MKVSYNWLRDYCAFDLAPNELAERLSQAGLNVETYEPVGDDHMLDVEVTTNRPDCLSHVGLAREIAALTGTRVTHPPAEVAEDAELRLEDLSSVRVTCKDLCPHYTARLIRGVRVGPSPEWLQKRLETCGVRPVNNVVDVTNYVLLETGQPLHAFDMARLDGGRIVVRRPKKGEKITTIDGTESELEPDMCLIADASKPVAVGGVMGGMESEISESTADVLLESARFAPANIRRTARALRLSSESSYRFERGVDPEGVEHASRRAARLILELAGGRLASGLGEVRAGRTPKRTVTMRYARMALVLGLEVKPDEVLRIFEGLELEITKHTRNRVTVRVPSWRGDLGREIDLIEEVARIHGYDKFGETAHMHVVPAALGKRQRCARTVRRLLAGAGFDEVMTYSLIAPSPIQRAQPWHDGEPLALRNPVSAERTHLRLTNMANLLGVKRFNAAHGTPRIDVFELAKVYLPRDTAAGELPREMTCLSVLSDRADGFFHLKGTLANILDALHVEAPVEEVPAHCEPMAEGESLLLRLDGELLGCLGVVSKDVATGMDLPGRPALLEVNFDLLIEKAQIEPTVRPVPRFPAVERDVAVAMDEGVRWVDLERCVKEAAPEALAGIEFFDVYRGKQVPAGKKSIAFSLTFRAPDRTLTSEEADAARDAIVAALKESLGAELR